MNRSIKIEDVSKQFNALPTKGHFERAWHLPYFWNVADDHVQGYTRTYDDAGNQYFIFSNSCEVDNAVIIVKSKIDSKNYRKIVIPREWEHPGGIQAIGNYLFVPCENKEKKIVRLFVYDLTKKKEEDPLCYKRDFDCTASSVGITDFVHNGIPYYLMVLNSNPECHFYSSVIPNDNDMTKLSFEPLISDLNLKIKCPDSDDFEGIGLVTSTDGIIYMIALGNRQLVGHDFADYAYLFRLDIEGSTIVATLVASRKMKCNGMVGLCGIHFRFGAGICTQIDKTGKSNLCLLATAKNIIGVFGNTLETNIWEGSTQNT